MSVYFDISRFKCPNCNQTIDVAKFQDFSTRFGKREAFDCPHCGTKLNWAKTPHNLGNYSLWAAVLTFPLSFMGLYSFDIGIMILGVCLLLCAIGMLSQELVIANNQ